MNPWLVFPPKQLFQVNLLDKSNWLFSDLLQIPFSKRCAPPPPLLSFSFFLQYVLCFQIKKSWQTDLLIAGKRNSHYLDLINLHVSNRSFGSLTVKKSGLPPRREKATTQLSTRLKRQMTSKSSVNVVFETQFTQQTCTLNNTGRLLAKTNVWKHQSASVWTIKSMWMIL